MKSTIHVATKQAYDVIVGQDLLDEVGQDIIKICPTASKAFVISDSNVASLYLDKIIASLRNSNLETAVYVFEAGEESKNSDTYIAILQAMASNFLTRTDVVVSLGGGVCSDMAGFAAATFLRGIDVIHVSTSLLGQVDASIGGKTGIDLPNGKNLVGAFWQPKLVVIDTNTLETLPREQIIEGMAEVIKYALIMDAVLYDLLKNTNLDEIITNPQLRYEMVRQCVLDKTDVVVSDEFDNGRRQILNFGHTIGHVLEKMSDFKLSHGRAVAKGMSIVLNASRKEGLCDAATNDNGIDLIKAYELSVEDDTSSELLAQGAMSDKKKRGGTVSLVVVSSIGEAKIVKKSIDELEAFLEARKEC
ncbi:MAG: 3-dehydroquinate synthase [Saccharofermentanaceae bacterium]|jgi:3-dehydroquinate synthase|nr:3-dehydroquinate synthase [Clostridia bacterium]NLX68224.1 3-dehydroquinate synthase [Clostridiaceae bacterium]HOO49104.1 3-dehydroquinate synthase [Saccharofermentans sp.]HPE27383.1 3-dehydroquinate synthase [Saccharofermentans sp.]HPG64146.1 3-dehydroquinate synthase [Saccharofermentans sp.]